MILSKEKLIELLETILKAVRADDSFSGSLTYDAAPTDTPSFEVEASVRVGNSEGQGGMMIIEASPDPENPSEPETPPQIN